MVEWLVEELASIGLHLNASKTKILCTSEHNMDYLDVGDTLVEVLSGDKCHKYLGRQLPGYLQNRGRKACEHRIQAAWCNFHKYQKVLVDSNVPINLRLVFSMLLLVHVYYLG